MPARPSVSVVPSRTTPRRRPPGRHHLGPAALALTAAGALGLTGCGASVNVSREKTIDLGEVQSTITKQYAAQGITLSKLDCKDGVELKVGAPITCSAANDQGTILNIAGSVTSTEGSGGRFRVRTVSAAVDGTKIADKARSLLQAKYEQEIHTLTCPDTVPVPTKPDVTCELTASDGSKVDVAVMLTATGDLSIQVADKVKSGPTG